MMYWKKNSTKALEPWILLVWPWTNSFAPAWQGKLDNFRGFLLYSLLFFSTFPQISKLCILFGFICTENYIDYAFGLMDYRLKCKVLEWNIKCQQYISILHFLKHSIGPPGISERSALVPIFINWKKSVEDFPFRKRAITILM